MQLSRTFNFLVFFLLLQLLLQLLLSQQALLAECPLQYRHYLRVLLLYLLDSSRGVHRTAAAPRQPGAISCRQTQLQLLFGLVLRSCFSCRLRMGAAGAVALAEPPAGCILLLQGLLLWLQEDAAVCLGDTQLLVQPVRLNSQQRKHQLRQRRALLQLLD
jgi:hypothetical protein